jgi:L-aminopeptidase/D-esterase-like protein
MDAENRGATGAVTDIAGIRVGNAQNLPGITGITVVLCEKGAVGSVQVFGGAPGTRETDLLRSSCTVDTVHAVFLAGGSAFGLNAVEGVVRYLEERKIGFDAGIARVPIVPGAVIFDLGVGNPASRPTPDMAYRACTEASSGRPKSGNVGAGAGATVGKLFGSQYLMKSGLGNSSVRTPSGYTVGAILAVNAVGDIHDPATGQIVAGAWDRENKRFLAVATRRTGAGAGSGTSPGTCAGTGSGIGPGAVNPTEGGTAAELDRPGEPFRKSTPSTAENTTIGLIVTDCALSKDECERVALMAMGGLAQVVRPSFTPFDGDTLFVLSTGEKLGPASDGKTVWTGRGLRAQLVAQIGVAAQDAVVLAVLDAVRSATGIPGIPAASDLYS